jgi:hypothetical protein
MRSCPKIQINNKFLSNKKALHYCRAFYLLYIIYASIISTSLSSFGAEPIHLSAFLFFLALTSSTIPAIATTKQLIQTTGLTANQDILNAKKPNIKVKAKAMIPVQTPIILDKNGNTFARVVINSNIIENQANINSNNTHLMIQVIALFAF